MQISYSVALTLGELSRELFSQINQWENNEKPQVTTKNPMEKLRGTASGMDRTLRSTMSYVKKNDKFQHFYLEISFTPYFFGETSFFVFMMTKVNFLKLLLHFT